jgi:sterol desaturase/sphingolipid hydroxylase (fatty acid hydroxylase superfamily)
VHAYTLLTWMVCRITETCDGHSGYDLPFMPFRLMPFAGTSAAHDAHHSINTGNYGTFLRVWDPLLGTAIPEEVVAKVQGVETQ